ncbi:MAG: hypothetical protein I3273_07065 [Candidatus Moeniiplasma glomeromycotorum]|nr:hypothetical protein [Candidatus Moeniiplasma glomeromycotorum]MCE8169847.1 hypothetical protein [Candidatus Moeniiplasma glomeromycotorum]
MIGLILGLIGSFFYYKWFKKQAVIHFKKNIGESEFFVELGKWQEENPIQARQMMTEGWKELGIYEELKSETNPEVINRRVMARVEGLTSDEKEKYWKKSMELYQEHAPSFLEKLNKKFPWYLRYYWLIIIFIVIVSSGVGFLVGYILEPKEE